mmetsp:Transcript_19370/g.25511  ORF Transcript_19370/g.25511 Transcript_19370/m.25511 type:complete len:126 (-) Transcript_19370:1559-1936(-)
MYKYLCLYFCWRVLIDLSTLSVSYSSYKTINKHENTPAHNIFDQNSVPVSMSNSLQRFKNDLKAPANSAAFFILAFTLAGFENENLSIELGFSKSYWLSPEYNTMIFGKDRKGCLDAGGGRMETS